MFTDRHLPRSWPIWQKIQFQGVTPSSLTDELPPSTIYKAGQTFYYERSGQQREAIVRRIPTVLVWNSYNDNAERQMNAQAYSLAVKTGLNN